MDKRNIRHATTEEIKAEKERRLWKSINRDVGGFKIGDAVIYLAGHTKRLANPQDVEFAKDIHGASGVYCIFPAESFISFEEGEEE